MRDYEIRHILKNTVLKEYFDDGISRVVEELTLPVAGARVDIAVVNGHLHAFEIKGANDTLQRLPTQMEAYEKVFDFISVVTEERYLKGVRNIIPKSTGIFICAGSPDAPILKQVRKPSQNKKRDGFYIAKLLWREELQEIFKSLNFKVKKTERNWTLCETLSASVEIEKLSEIVRTALKARKEWKSIKVENAIK